MNQTRQPRGIPFGGRFKAFFADESNVTLTDGETGWAGMSRRSADERLSLSTKEEDRISAAKESKDDSVVNYLSFDPEPLVRAAAATNKHLAPRLVVRLTNDPEPLVRAVVAKHRSLGIPELDKMLRDDDETVIDAIEEAVEARGLGRIVPAALG